MLSWKCKFDKSFYDSTSVKKYTEIVFSVL